MSNLRVGDRVELSSETTFRHDNSNPAVGSEYYCTGVVTAVHDTTGFNLNVNWDNGYNNSYRSIDGDIVLVIEDILV